MRRSIFVSLLACCSLAAFWMMIAPGCANIVPPSGGPRDSLPPVLLRADPPDSTVNFRARSVRLTFNEFIDLRESQKNIMITPDLSNRSQTQVQGRTIVIPLKDSLLPNTTYVINFNDAIVDLNEGNALRNFSYTFSTGPVLDSLTISGRVLLAETGGIDSTIYVLLYRNLADSAVRLQRAPYVTRVDRNGNFLFKNLPKDTFALYALGSASARQYTTTSDLFAFADRPVISGETDSALLYAYRETPPRQAIAPTPRIPANDRRLRFSPGSTGAQDLTQDFVLNFPVPLRDFDSTKVRLTADSVYTPLTYTTRLDSARQVLSFRTDWKPATRYNLELDKDFAADTVGRKLLKTDTIYFTTKKATEYGGLTIRFRNLDLTRKPLLQFLQNNTVQVSAPLTSAVYSANVLPPGDYTLRIVFDANGNGRWDPGKFFGERRQPERILPVERTVSVKPSFDNEIEIVLSSASN